MKKIIKEIFTGVNGVLSSKRVVTMIAVFLMTLAFLLDLFIDLSVPQFMYEAIMYIVIAGVGFTGAEQFARGKTGVTGASQTGGDETNA